MTLNKREKIIASTLGGALLVYLAGAYLVGPYFSGRQDLNAAIQKAENQQKHDTQLLAERPKVAAEWTKLTGGPLKSQTAQATSEISDALFDWARTSRFKLQALQPDRAVQKGDFQQIHFKVSGEGSSETLAAFLLSIETTDLPLQIDECRVNARKEGINDLTVQLTVTTVVFAPSTTTRPAVKSAAPTGDSL